jgi:autotransporter-associated beta strand protein
MPVIYSYADGETNPDPIEITLPDSQLEVATGEATQEGVISEAGPSYGFEKIGDGTLILTADNTYTGPTVISEGTLVLAAPIAVDSASAFTIAEGATLAFGADTLAAFLGSIAGAGDVDLGAGLLLELDDVSTELTFSGSIFDDPGGLGFFSICGCGGGSLTLTGDSEIGGILQVGFGGLLIIDGGSFTAEAGVSAEGTLRVVNGATLDTALLDVSGTLEVDGADSVVTATDMTDVSYALIVSGGGVVNSEADAILATCGCGDDPATAEITGTGSHWNVTGVLYMDWDDAPGVLTVADGGKVTATESILVAGESQIKIGTGGLGGTIDTPEIETESDILANFTDAVTLAADISGIGGISKAGAGTLTLSGTSSFTGGTALDAGGITITNGSALGTGTLEMAEGTRLLLDGSFTLGIAITVEGDPILEVGTGDTATITGIISDGASAGIVEKTGTGTLVLDAINTYSGGTIISAGILRATTGTGSGGSSVGTGTVTLDGGTFQAGDDIGLDNDFAVNTTGGTIDTNGKSLTLSGDIENGDAGGGTLTKAGLGVLSLDGSSTYSGPTLINAGELFARSNTALSQLSAFTVANGATLRVDENLEDATIGSLAGAGTVALGDGAVLTAGGNNTSTTFSGGITGDGAFAKAGTGTQTLTGTSSFTGGTMLDAGAIAITNGSALGTGTLAMAEGTTLVLDGSFTLGIAITVEGDPTIEVGSGDTGTVTGIISDGASAGIVEKTGTGTLVLDAINTYSGGTIVSAGILRATTGTGSGGSSVGNGAVTLDGATFQAGDDIGLANDFKVNATGGTIDTAGHSLLIAGDIEDGTGAGGTLTKAGLGVLSLKGDNTYTGPTSINAGEVLAQSDGALSQFSAFTVAAGATLRLDENIGVATIGSLAGAGTVALGDGAVLTAGRNNSSTTFSGGISGDGAFAKTGSGTQTLTGTSSFTGGTMLDAGAIAITRGSALGTGTLAMAEGTRLVLDGSFTLGIAITVAGDPTFEVGSGDTATLTGIIGDGATAGIVEKTGAGSLILDAVNTYSGGTALHGGALAITNASALGTGPLAMSDGTRLTLDGSFSLATGITLAGDSTVEVRAGDTPTITGIIRDGSDPGVLVKTGAGVLTLDALNSFSGGSIISAGVLRATLGTDSGASSVGAGTVTLDGGRLQAAASIVLGNDFAVNGTGGTIDTNGKDLTLTGDIGNGSGAGGTLTKAGLGMLTLAGDSSFDGSLSVAAGLLRVTGSIDSAATVRSGATLGGTGTAAAVTVAGGGTLAPGSSTGILTTGNLALAAGATFAVELAGTTPGTGYDRVTVHGTVSLGGSTLDLDLLGGFDPTIGTNFTIVANDGGDAVTGIFAGLAEGASFAVDGAWFAITYAGGDGNDVVLTAEAAPPTQGVTIIGTDDPDIVDATVTVPGQPYPTKFADEIFGLGGGDTLSGLDGDDTIRGAGGADTIFGGNGDDSLRGGGGSDVIHGEAGDDALIGGRRGDTLYGGDGEDSLTGGRGDDVLYGGSGDDTLNGGTARNTLYGGEGNDSFAFTTRNTLSKVKDFAEGDTIAIGRSAFSGIGPRGVLEAKYFHIGSEAETKKQHILYDADSGWLLYARHGSNTANPQAFVKIGKHLDHFDHTDILVI